LDGEKADMMLTDPPYGVDYSSKNEFLNKFDKGNCNQRPIQNDAIKDYRNYFSKVLSLAPLLEKNTAYVFMSGQELHNLRLALDDSGYKWSDYLIWKKNNHVLGRKDYNSKHEFIVYCWRGTHKFYGDGSAVTVLEFDRPLKSDLHPTMKPVALIEKLIKDGSPVNATIYEPFSGSGTTIIASESLARKCYAMEIEPIYCDVAVKRWEDLTGKTAERIASD